jgi:hypothetical protein
VRTVSATKYLFPMLEVYGMAVMSITGRRGLDFKREVGGDRFGGDGVMIFHAENIT